MAYRVGTNVTTKQMVDDLYDFLTTLSSVTELDYLSKGNGTLDGLHVERTATAETWTLTFVEYNGDGKAVFDVQGTVTGDSGQAVENELYDNGQVSFTILPGDTQWVAGDRIVFKVEGGSLPPFEVLESHRKLIKFQTKRGKWARPVNENYTYLGIIPGRFENTWAVRSIYGNMRDKKGYNIPEDNITDYNVSPEGKLVFSFWIRNLIPYSQMRYASHLMYNWFDVDIVPLDYHSNNFFFSHGYIQLWDNSIYYMRANDYYYDRMYTPFDWHLFVIIGDRVNGIMKIYMDDANLVYDGTVSTAATTHYNITRWFTVMADIYELVQWNDVLEEGEIQALYAATSPLSPSDSRIWEMPIISDKYSLRQFIVKSTTGSDFPVYLKIEPYPFGRSYTQPLLHIDAGHHFVTSVENDLLPILVDEYQFSVPGTVQNYGFHDYLTKKINSSQTSNYTRTGLLIREPEEKINKYWFVSDGEFLIVVLKIYDEEASTPYPVYQVLYAGPVNCSGTLPYLNVVQSTHNGQDSWTTTDSNFTFEYSRRSSYGILDCLLKNNNDQTLYKNGPTNIPYWADINVNYSFEVLPVYSNFAGYNNSNATINYIFKNLYFSPNVDLSPEDLIYLNGKRALVVQDGNATEHKIIVQLDL